MKKKILCVIMLIVLILSSNIAITFAATKSELESEQASNEQKIKEKENEVKEVKKEMSSTMEQIQELNSKISTYKAEITELNSELEELEDSIEEAEVKLEEAEKKYNEQQEALQARIVAQYEAGETTYLDVILGGGSIWDMISNWQLVSDIAEMDNKMLEEIEANKNEIEEAKNTLETSKKQVETVKSNKESTAKTLEESQNAKEKYVSELGEDEKALNEDIEKLEAENDAITKELEAMENKYSDEIANLGGTGTLQRPVKSGVITATMYYSSGAYHGALDYGVPIGTNVYAAADGVVLQASWRSGGLGNCVVLQHSGGLRTYYGHGNGTFYVKPGQVVKKGQLIMLSGNTGNSSGPHLHFEVRVSPYNWSYGGNDSRRDPRNYM